MLWSAYVDAYLRALRLQGGELNVAKARDILGRFTRYCDPVLLENVTQAMYVGFLARRQQDKSRSRRGADGELLTLSNATLNGDIRYLNAAFAAALPPTDEHPDRLGVAPEGWRAPKRKRLRELERLPKSLTQDAFAKVFEAARHAKRPGLNPAQWWQTFFLIAYVTGLRCKELRQVKRPSAEHLALGELPLPAEIDKRGIEHKLPIPPGAVNAIRNMPESPDGLLFSWPFCPRWFYATLHQFQTKAGLPTGDHGLPHDFRRTKCTELIRAGHSMPLIQREMRHSTLDMVMRYTGAISEEQKTAVAELPLPEEVGPLMKSTVDDPQLCLAFPEEF